MVSGLTLVGRVLGMIRDIISAKSFGTSWQWDAFTYSFMLPNFMRRLVGEGALSSAFIPVYAEVRAREGEEAGLRLANVVFTLLFWGLLGFLVAVQGILFLLLQLPTVPPTIRLTCELLQILFPYLLFISLCALAMGILNSHHHFFSPGLSPVILDLVWIAGVIWVSPLGGSDAEKRVFLLAVCLLISGAIQLGVQVPFLARCGFRPRFVFDFLDPAIGRIGKLILPAVLGFAVVQVNILVDMTLAFWVGPGANSSLWYGNRLMQFPLGVFAIAMGTALLPAISHHTARQELDAAKRTLSFALRSVFLIIFPATAGLIVLRTPIVQLLFERGEFDALSTARTSFVVLCYTIGLFAYSGQKLIVTGFYSLQDTKTPMKIGAIALVVNIVLNLILMGPLKEGGLALATSIAGIFNFVCLVYLYQRRLAGLDLKEILISSGKILGASLLMGILAWPLFQGIYSAVGGTQTFRLLAGVLGSIGISVPIYLGLCLLFRVREVHEAIAWLRQARERTESEERPPALRADRPGGVGEEPL